MEENKKCKREIANLVEKNSKLGKENGWLKEKLKMHDSSENKLKVLQDTIADLQKQQLEKDKSLTRIQEQNMALQKEIQTLYDKNAIQTTWQEQQAKDLEGFEKLKKEAKIMTSEINDLKHQNGDLKKKDQQNQNKIQELQNLIQNECTKSMNVQTSSDSRHRLSEKSLAALNDTVESLQREKDGVLGELNTCRKQVKSFEKDIGTLTEEIQREEMNNKELSELLGMKTSVSDKLQAELQAKNAQIESLEQEAVKARKIIDRLQLQLDKLHLEIENYQKRNVASTLCLKKEMKAREENERKLLTEVLTLKNQIEQTDGRFFNVQTDLSKSEKEIASLKELNVTLDREIIVLKAELEDVRCENQSLNDRLEQVRKQMEETEARGKEELLVVHGELTKVRDMVSVTEVERQRLAKELEGREQVDLLKDRTLKQLENEKSMVEDKIIKLTEENSNLLEANKKLRQFEECWVSVLNSIIGKKD
ncbi:CAP-Gly domain-containing linker protein 1-like [Fundulus heteroclitus]|uniref:CAP-Gly domain-containing linker protein 1-like n=1 Tax=Fundulus heteroclitus TaxID=8078 RepID=UPI00165A5AA1|nr:CAP-Gly domain-containing linker protein 1-like [Fundulus heteroclitus]